MDLIIFLIFLARAILDLIFERLPLGAGGTNMTAGALLNLLILALSGTLIVARFRSSLPIKIWLPYLAVATLSTLTSGDFGSSFRTLLVLFTYAGLFAIPFYMRASRRDSLWLLNAIVYSSILPAAYGVLEFFFFKDPNERLRSTFAHANVFACYLTLVIGVICFLLGSTSVRVAPWMRKVLMLYLLPLIALLILTESRVGWAGALLALATYAFMLDRRYLLLLAFVPFLIFVPQVSDRLSDLDRGAQVTADPGTEGINSYAWRMLMWESAWDDLDGSRVLGKGLASFGPNSLRFFPLVSDKTQYTYKGVGAHSVYVQTVYELGFVGLFCYVAIYIGLVVRACRYMRYDKKGAIMMIAIVGAYMLQNYSDNILDYGSVNLYFWGTIGTILAKWSRQASLNQREANTVDRQMRTVGPITER